MGTPVRLSDGRGWLLASPVYRPGLDGLTIPRVDRPLDRVIDHLALGEDLGLEEIWEAARAMLKANYELNDDEIAELLSVAPGPEAHALAEGVLGAMIGPEDATRTYTDWVRASLIANNLGSAEIAARDLPNVLAILVATNRTVPIDRFADACRAAGERQALEALV
jgi:hypothetical protein